MLIDALHAEKTKPTTWRLLAAWLRRLGLAALLATFGVLLHGLARGARQPARRQTGREPAALRTRGFYALAGAGYAALCYALWRPLPLRLTRPGHVMLTAAGAPLYLAGLLLVLWGRVALADLYAASSSLGAHLPLGHRLVTRGPFALVRHPIYLGVLLIGAGGLLLYRTWTFALLLLNFPALVLRARREEQLLAAEYGAEWTAYCHTVPAWLPAQFTRARPLQP